MPQQEETEDEFIQLPDIERPIEALIDALKHHLTKEDIERVKFLSNKFNEIARKDTELVLLAALATALWACSQYNAAPEGVGGQPS